ncbi:MAG TPA: MamK family actin-like protein [Sedimentisphaerales bacterium]|nr:MamK family actin-like protein [Sedimentisphaerales bacterium]
MAKKQVKKHVSKPASEKISQGYPLSETFGAFAAGDEAVFVGIDLGTSRASIAASNGVREVVPTYVGYPKDNISEELLGAEPLFGDLALKHRLSLELVRPLEHGVIRNDGRAGQNKNLVAAQQLVRHLLQRTNCRPDQPVYGVIGAPARASISSKRVLIEAARGILDAVMIVSEPFSVAYGLGILDRALIIDIGAGTVDLCRLHGTLPEAQDQITLDQAGDFVDEKLSELIRRKYPSAQFNINMVRALKERYGFVSDNADRVMARFPVQGRPKDFDITGELRTACRSIVPGIINSIGRLIATYDPEFQEGIRSNVILAGGGSQMTGLKTLIEQGMNELGGGRVTCAEEPVFAGANGALKMAQRMPRHFWQLLVKPKVPCHS